MFPPDRSSNDSFAPRVPYTVEDTGLSQSIIEHIIFNILYARGEVSGRNIADTMGLSFSVIEAILNELKIQKYVDVKRSLGYGMISSDFVLSEVGRKRAREYADIHQYVGPAPIPSASTRPPWKPNGLVRDGSSRTFSPRPTATWS